MKKSSLRNLGVMAVVLCLVTTCLLGGTLAKYTSTVNGTATFIAAKWSFKANNQEENFTVTDIGRSAYTNTDIADGVIAPGVEGAFDVVLDASESQVGVGYTIKITNADETGTVTIPTGLLFSTDGTTYKALDNLGDITGTIDYSSSEMKKTVQILWKWEYGAESDDTSSQGKSIDLKIGVTGTQVTPVESEVTPGA